MESLPAEHCSGRPIESDRISVPDWAGFIQALSIRSGISAVVVDRVWQAATSSNIPFSAAATRLGVVSESDVTAVFSDLLGIEVVGRQELADHVIDAPELNVQFLKRHRVVPFYRADNQILLAMANPFDDVAVDGIKFALRQPIGCCVATESDIDDELNRHYNDPQVEALENGGPRRRDSDAQGDDLDRLSDHDSDAPAIRMAHRIITRAVDEGASDIHLEPDNDVFVVRFRIDGHLALVETLSTRWIQPLSSRLKLMAKLDIAEKRLPQDGRIHFATRGRRVDLRIATFPTLHGESIVLRLLGQHTSSPKLSGLGIGADSLESLQSALQQPHGIALITGPTGSGKTTTLYAALNEIHRPQLKIVTVEDPIEYTLPGVAQLQVKADIGLTYAAALRSVLRNDPDVIMVGEIRDRETADIAIRAALTGHLVLATLHTNTAAGAVTRLVDLGVERYLLASTLIFSAAQRLVRRLCPNCKRSRPLSPAEVALLSATLPAQHIPAQLPEAGGCELCNGHGFRGRIPLFEALPIGPNQRDLIASAADEKAIANSFGDKTRTDLWQAGVQLVLAGKTTLDEVTGVIEDRPG
jgi:general secretion pathway protein E